MSLKILENVPLAPFTTLGIGGNARFFVEATSDAEIFNAFEYARERSLEVFVLGGGSNIVVSDAGFEGLVVKVALSGITFETAGSDHVWVSVGAGESWDEFVGVCVEKALAGIECLSGIPGCVGGTPVQNVGAYGQEVAETIESVRCFDRQTGRIIKFSNAECRFSYRKSTFNSDEKGRYVVLSVRFRLELNGKPTLRYKELAAIFSNGNEPTLSDVREAVLSIRRSKAMVIDAADPDSKSVGSFFKNPIVPVEQVSKIATAAGVDEPPVFDAGDGKMKLSAAWLIEMAGFHKGYRRGRAAISTRHSLALVNLGGATARELITLKDEIQDRVALKFGISLETEPVLVGF